MRALINLLIFVFLTASAEAAVFSLPGPGQYTVEGPFPNTAILDAHLSVSFTPPIIPPEPPPGSWSYSGYSLFVYANNSLLFFSCGGNVGADCGYRYVRTVDSFVIFDSGPYYPNLYIDFDEFSFGELRGSLLGPVRLSIDLPDGYFIAAPVPEPSTWAMLLIGFTGIGFVGYRRQRGILWPRRGGNVG